MNNGKAHIIAAKNGVPVGYVKSISLRNGTFQTTPSLSNAKGYSSPDILNRDLSNLNALGFNQGVSFFYN